jgi:hypothetical protein
MDDRAQRRAAVLADLNRAFRRRKLQRLHAVVPSVPAIIHTGLIAGSNQVRRDVARSRGRGT